MSMKQHSRFGAQANFQTMACATRRFASCSAFALAAAMKNFL
jgi:hypothetical protein